MKESFKEQYVLVTGGSSGIGKATARMLKERGAEVGIVARGKERLDATAEELGVKPFAADVSKEDEVMRIYAEFLEWSGGKLDCLVNNAAIGGGAPLVEIDAAKMRSVWEVNVLGATLMAREAAKVFVKQDYGDLVNVGSTASHRGYARGSIYSSTKFALKSLSECWRAELRPHNVRVISVFPSELTTAFGQPDGREREERPDRLRADEIAYTIVSTLEMDTRGFIPEVTVFATNPK